MTVDTGTTYLDVLLGWATTETITLNRRTAENQWLSIPLPTRRFGPDAWVMCAMDQTAGEPRVGPFKAWIVLANKRPRLIAYLESPFADSFGTIEPFEIEGGGIGAVDASVLSGLGAAGTAFFDSNEPTGQHRRSVGRFLAAVGGSMAARLQDVAPDFFTWAERTPVDEEPDGAG